MSDSPPASLAATPRQHRLRARYGPGAVVTGASSGIGREMAARLAVAGFDLLLVARARPALDRLAADLAARHGVAVHVLAVDLADPAAAEAVLAAADDIDVGLLICAAGFGSSGPLVEADVATELAMIDVNCRAVLALSLPFGRRFAARGRGGIVLMSSLLAFQGVPLAANYAATKAYVQSLAEALHAELAPRGVDVVASAPGPIHSGFAARANMRLGIGQHPRDVAQATLDALGRRATVRPGWLSKLLEISLAPLPRRGRVRIMAIVMRGMARGGNGTARGPSPRPA